MNVKLYAYNFYTTKISNEYDELDDFAGDFLGFLKWLLSKSAVERNKDYPDINKKIYLEDMKYTPEDESVFMIFKSAEYNKVRKVINTDTLEEKPNKRKKRNEGDEESTCLLMQFESNRDAIGIFQVNRSGVGISKVVDYLNKKLLEYHRTVLGDRVLYAVHYINMVSEDFLEAITNTRRIKAMTLVVDSKELGSDFLEVSGMGDLRKEMEVVLKPYRGDTIRKDTVENYYYQLKKHGNLFRKISVDVDKMDGEPVSFDTEKVKKTFVLDVNDIGNGTPDITELQSGMKKRMTLLYEASNE